MLPCGGIDRQEIRGMSVALRVLSTQSRRSRRANQIDYMRPRAVPYKPTQSLEVGLLISTATTATPQEGLVCLESVRTS